MSIQGMRATDDIILQYGDRPENWRMGILLLDPNGDAPLFGLTSMMKSESVDDPVYHWFEEENPDYRVALSANIDDAVTALPVVSGALQFKEGDILRIENTDEIVIVTANPTVDTSIPVSRGAGGSTATAVTYAGAGVNPNIMLIGSAYEEGSQAPDGRSYNAEERNNYCQIFRDTFDVTNTMTETELRTGDSVKEDKRRCLDRISKGIERTFFFGRKAATVKNGRPRRFTGGIISQIPTENVATPSSGDWTMEELEDYLRHIFTYGANEKLCFCGNRFALGIQQIIRKNSHYNIEAVQKEYGMSVRRLVTPFGTLVLKTHPQFNQLSSGTTGGTDYNALDTWGVILDAARVKYRYLKNRDLKYETNLQLPGQDGKKAGYIAECGMQLTHPKTCGLIKGLRKGLKDAE